MAEQINRAKLEEAINGIDRALAHLSLMHWDDAIQTLRKFDWESVKGAAETYAATLPKTKMVEQFRVEFAQTNPSAKGKWHAASAAFNDRAAADAYAHVVRSWDNTACIYVTGPHMQEVPA